MLGRGCSGVVYLSFHSVSVSLVALKCIPVFERHNRKQLTQELRSLEKLNNEYTIGFLGAYFAEGCIYIALEYMECGSLADLVDRQLLLQQKEEKQITSSSSRRSSRSKKKPVLDEHMIAFAFEQVLKGLQVLHGAGLIHRDIKPHNILYNKKAQFKLTDFGILCDVKEHHSNGGGTGAYGGSSGVQGDKNKPQGEVTTTFIGTLMYMSSERISGQPYSYSCDIWSVALSILTCIVGEYPIPHEGHWQLISKISAGANVVLEILKEYSISNELYDFLYVCLDADPKQRPTASECLRHPFFQYYCSLNDKHIISLPNSLASSLNSSSTPSPSPLLTARSLSKEKETQRKSLEKICTLLATKGLTSYELRGRLPASSNATTSIPSLPFESSLYNRLSERLSHVLEGAISLDMADIRSALLSAHNNIAQLPPETQPQRRKEGAETPTSRTTRSFAYMFGDKTPSQKEKISSSTHSSSSSTSSSNQLLSSRSHSNGDLPSSNYTSSSALSSRSLSNASLQSRPSSSVLPTYTSSSQLSLTSTSAAVNVHSKPSSRLNAHSHRD